MKEEIELCATHCRHEDCIYRGFLYGTFTPFCDYISVMGESRKCKISECDKYKSGKKVQPRINMEYKIWWEREIYDDDNPIW